MVPICDFGGGGNSKLKFICSCCIDEQRFYHGNLELCCSISKKPTTLFLLECLYQARTVSGYVFVCWGYQFYLFLCICVLKISVWPLSMYLCVEDIGFTSFYVFVCWGYRFDLFLCICVLRISVLPLSMYLCVEDIGFTSFYVFVC